MLGVEGSKNFEIHDSLSWAGNARDGALPAIVSSLINVMLGALSLYSLVNGFSERD
jgi:hypothetical protein